MKELFFKIFFEYFDKNTLWFIKTLIILNLAVLSIAYSDFSSLIKFFLALLSLIIFIFVYVKYLIYCIKKIKKTT